MQPVPPNVFERLFPFTHRALHALAQPGAPQKVVVGVLAGIRIVQAVVVALRKAGVLGH